MKSDGQNGKDQYRGTVERQQEKGGKRGNMQKVEEREGDHEAGKMTGKAVYK